MTKLKVELAVRIAALGFCFVVFGASRALSADRYLRSDATGANNGTSWTDAWTSLATAEANLSRGDTLWVADGNYTGNVTFNVAASGTTLITIKKATVASHGGSTGWNNNLGDGEAVISSWLNFTTAYWLVDGNCEWPNGVGFRVNCTTATGFGSVRFGAPNCTLSGVHLYGTYNGPGSSANFAAAADNVTISNVWFHGSTWEDHIYNVMTGGFLTIDRCRFDHTGHPNDGVHRDLMNVDYYQGSCGGFDLTVRNCIINGDYGDAFLLQNSLPMGNILFENNVFSVANFALRFGSGNTGMKSGAKTIILNSVYNSVADYSGPNGYYTNNVYMGSSAMGGVHYQGGNPSHCAWVVGCGGYVSGDGNMNNVSPNFFNSSKVDGADGIPFTADDGFNIAANSPLIDKGGVTGRATDILGKSVNGNNDIGAYEYGTASTNPVISVSPTSLDFGVLQVTKTRDLAFTVRNTGAGTLGGSASVAAPFSIVSGGNYSLVAGQSQSVTVRYSPTVGGTNSQNVTFTGGGGATANVHGLATLTNTPPTVSAISHNAADVSSVLPGLQILEGTTVQYSGSASDSDGDALTWQWIYTVNGGAEVVYQTGAGTVSPISFDYGAGTANSTYVWKLRVNDGQANGESQLTLGVISPPAAGASVEAESGVITSPFVSSGGSISQPSTTDINGGGRATYGFSVTNAGDYVIQALVDAPSLNENSFYLNIDAEPQDPYTAWDILPPTSGFENRIVSWRGNGTPDSNEIVRAVFNLQPGSHQLIIRGREANTLLDRFSVERLPNPPGRPQVVPSP